jgi:hypothetical protein
VVGFTGNGACVVGFTGEGLVVTIVVVNTGGAVVVGVRFGTSHFFVI